MEKSVLPLAKATLGYTTTIRDELLKAIIKGIETELTTTYGLDLDDENSEHIMLVCDLSVFRYKNQGGSVVPRNLDFRIKNLIISSAGD